MVTPRDKFSALPAASDDAEAINVDDASLPDSGAVVEHPDGFYWLSPDGRQQFGPYATAEEALAEMHAAGDDAFDAGETPHEALEEAEHELGIADWVDPETGEPGAQAGPHIEDH